MPSKLFKISAFLMSIYLLSPLLHAAPLKLVTLQYPPYAYQQGDKVEGLAVKIVEEAFKRIQQPVEIQILPWARAIAYVESGKVDAIFTAYKTTEREQFADYSNEVLIDQFVTMFVKSDSSISFDGDLNKLSDYQFGTVRKVSYGNIFDTAVKDGILKNIQYAKMGEMNIKKLLAGRFDILVSNRYGALHILKQTNSLDKVKELRPELQSIPSYIAFSKKNELVEIRNQYDLALKQMKTDGSYQDIIGTFFNQQSQTQNIK